MVFTNKQWAIWVKTPCLWSTSQINVFEGQCTRNDCVINRKFCVSPESFILPMVWMLSMNICVLTEGLCMYNRGTWLPTRKPCALTRSVFMPTRNGYVLTRNVCVITRKVCVVTRKAVCPPGGSVRSPGRSASSPSPDWSRWFAGAGRPSPRRASAPRAPAARSAPSAPDPTPAPRSPTSGGYRLRQKSTQGHPAETGHLFKEWDKNLSLSCLLSGLAGLCHWPVLPGFHHGNNRLS